MLFFVYLSYWGRVVSQQLELCIFRCAASAAHFLFMGKFPNTEILSSTTMNIKRILVAVATANFVREFSYVKLLVLSSYSVCRLTIKTKILDKLKIMCYNEEKGQHKKERMIDNGEENFVGFGLCGGGFKSCGVQLGE